MHRRTVNRLRAEIEPVAPRDFLRFLFDWQHVDDDARLEGPDALPQALAMLEGFEAPARAWETEILSARLKGYQPSWLDAECQAGRVAWTRLTPAAGAGDGARSVSPVPATPIALIDRRRIGLWTLLAPQPGAPSLGGRAEAVLDASADATAPCSSTSSSTPPGCCAPRSSRRSANWSLKGSSRPTGLRACAPC